MIKIEHQFFLVPQKVFKPINLKMAFHNLNPSRALLTALEVHGIIPRVRREEGKVGFHMGKIINERKYIFIGYHVLTMKDFSIHKNKVTTTWKRMI